MTDAVPEVALIAASPRGDAHQLPNERQSSEDIILNELANIVNSKAYRSRGPSRNLTTSQVLMLGQLPDVKDPSEVEYEAGRMNAGVGKVAALAHSEMSFNPATDLTEVASLGEGAFAVVDLCRTSKRQFFPKHSEAFKTGLIAAKRLKPERIAEEPLEFDNLLSEAALMKTLVHKNVIESYGCVEYKDQFTGAPSAMILLEYLKGGTLRQRIARKDYDGKTALRWLIEIAEGMEYLHSVANIGVAHRDLKPENILLDEHGVAKIADMGMARIAMRAASGGVAHVELEHNFQTASAQPSYRTPTGLAMRKSFSVTCRTGTPRYMAPENWAGNSYTYKVDIFSYAILALEVLSGRRAYGEVPMSGQTLADAVAQSGLRPTIPEGWPPEIVACLTASWSADADERPDFSTILLTLRSIQARALDDPALVENFVSPPAERAAVLAAKQSSALSDKRPKASSKDKPRKSMSSMCVVS